MKAKILVCVLISLPGLAGCDSALEAEPPSTRTVDNFYQNERQAQLALNGVYSTLWQAGMYQDGEFPMHVASLTGEVLKSENNEIRGIDQFTFTPSQPVFGDLWTAAYLGINRANTLLAGLAEADIDSAAKSSIRGQTRFLRGMLYFDLVRSFGGVPLYTEPTRDESNANQARATAEEVYAQVVADLQAAEEDLSASGEGAPSAGRADAGAARALLAKVHLQRRQWQEAASKAKEVIDMEQYGLFEDYADVFDPAHEDGVEHIFAVQYLNNQGSSAASGNHLTTDFGPPNTSLPDGTRVTFAPDESMGQTWSVTQDFFSRTPSTYRKWMSVRTEMPYYYELGSTSVVRDTVALAEPTVVKYYQLNTDTGQLNTGVNVPVLRYADVLLMYAEALNESNGGPTAEAYAAVNQVRRRARGMGTAREQPEIRYPDLAPPMSQSAFRQAVLQERAREFVAEGQRRWDLLRHDLLLAVNEERGLEVAARHKLFPLPATEASRNPNLEQNSGW